MALPCLVSTGVPAQLVRRPVTASYAGTGAYSLHHTDAFSVIANTAALNRVKKFTAGVYGEQRFMLKELAHYTAAFVLPTQTGNFAVTTAYRGSTDMNEYQLGLAYARSLGKTLDMGVKFNYNGLKINGYGNASAIAVELGTVLHVTDKLHSGIQVINPFSSKFGGNKTEKLAAVYVLGAGYEPSDKFFISAECIKEEKQGMVVQAGMQYRLLSFLQARAGISSGITSYWLGVGLGWRNLRLDVMTGYHNRLGLSPGIMLIYEHK